MCLSRFVSVLTPVLLVCFAFSGSASSAQEEPRPLAAVDYHIAGGDTIQITVWMQLEHTRVVWVNADGNINLPLVHNLKVSGLTAADLAKLLNDKLQGTVHNPQVTVRVVPRLSEPSMPPLPGVRRKVPLSPELGQKCCVS